MIYGLIGRKLGHSFSARFFNEKFEKEGISAKYELFEIPGIYDINGLINDFPDLVGFNVTIPYKQEIMAFLSTITSSAREIGAVNTVKVFRPDFPDLYKNHKGFLIGHNTDAPGFKMALLRKLNNIRFGLPRRAIVLGTGGASRAITQALKELGINYQLVSRKKNKGTLSYEELTEDIIRSHKLIVNCTPLGMWPDIESFPPIPYSGLDSEHLCFDIVYNPETTLFMKLSKAKGAEVCNGLEMLYNQAKLAWEFWNKDEVRRFMANTIKVLKDNREIITYPLSIAEIRYSPDGSIKDLNIFPFTSEIPDVIYLDSTLTIPLS